MCRFQSISTDPDETAGDAVTSYSWSFGDGSAPATTFNPEHTYAAAGTYQVTLRVGDRFGATNTSLAQSVTVTAPPSPTGPSADFTAACVSLDCRFTDVSTFTGGVFQSRVWNFGDGTPTAAANPVDHRYSVTKLESYKVTLEVTDNAGRVSSSTKTVQVAPPASTSTCVGGGCALTLTQAATVTATIVNRSCVARGNQVRFTAPIAQLVFADGCYDTPINVPVPIGGGQVFAAGTTLEVAVSSGVGTDALLYPPSIRVSGNFTVGWTLSFDDGKGGAGEPDFNDLIILIKATP